MRKKLLFLFALLCFAVSGAWAYEVHESFDTNQQKSAYESDYIKISCNDQGNSQGMALGGALYRYIWIESKHNAIIKNIEFTVADATGIGNLEVWGGTYEVNSENNKKFTITLNSDNTSKVTLYSRDTSNNLYVNHVEVDYEPTELAPNAAGEYSISNTNEWGLFCSMVNNGKTTFSGKKVVLRNDITGVTTMAGHVTNAEQVFSGTFDGQGHTLTVNLESTENRCSPFRVVKDATIQNLRVAGTITCKNYSGGIIGATEGQVTLKNCCSAVTFTKYENNNTGQDIGGLIGCVNSSSSLNVEGCSFTGSMNLSQEYCGGMVGRIYPENNPININNCVVKPSGVVNCGDNSSTFASRGTISNCYYFTAIGTAQGKMAHSITSNVALENVGTPATEYTYSGITAYSTGIKYESVFYAGLEDVVSLALTPSDGSAVGSVSASAGTLSGSNSHYSLTMPDANVIITATPVTGYHVSVDDLVSSETTLVHFETDEIVYGENQTVTLTVTLDNNMLLESVSCVPVSPEGANPIEVTKVSDTNKYTFTMPACDVEVNYTYKRFDGRYKIECGSSNYTMLAQVDGIDVVTADEGDLVTVSFSNNNKKVVNVTVTETEGTSGNSIAVTKKYFDENVYTFTMPAGPVMVNAEFKDYGIYLMTAGHCTIEARVNGSQLTVVDGLVDGSLVGFMAANQNDNVTLTVTPEEGNAIFRTIVAYNTVYNDASKVDATHYSFTMPASGVTVYPLTAYALADKADNSSNLSTHNGEFHDVMLQGRTLYKDGYWNTLCLPFDLKAIDFNASLGNKVPVGDTHPFDGAEVMVLSDGNASENGTTGFDATTGTLYLYFEAPETTVNAEDVVIPAGMPFIIKWEGQYKGEPLVDPVICGVTIDNAEPSEIHFNGGKFVGSYSPISITAEDRSILFLGDNNTLYYPLPSDAETPVTIGAFRAYFQLDGIKVDPKAPQSEGIRQFVLNTGDGEQTSIIDVEAKSKHNTLNTAPSAWYTLDGRRLSPLTSQPSTLKKGVYIYNGKKVVIK